MDEHPNAAIARSGYEAMEKGDIAAFAALLDDDVYHLRSGKVTEHWHLAVDPKANEEFLTD